MVLTVSAMSTVRKTALRLLLPAAFIFWLPAPAAEVLIVDQNGGGDFTGIQSALDAAQDGDTVLVMPGVYRGVRFNRLFRRSDPESPLLKNLALVSAFGPGQTVIRGGVRFLNGESSRSVVRGFTLDGDMGSGRAYFGIVATRGASPVIERCVIRNFERFGVACGDRFGGAITLIDCVFSGNGWERESRLGGAIGATGCEVTLTNCIMVDNVGPNGAAVYAVYSSVSMVNCLVAGNRGVPPGLGAALYFAHSAGLLRNCTIANNRSFNVCYFWQYDGRLGGIDLSRYYGNASDVVLENCIIWDNQEISLWVAPNCKVNLINCCINDREVLQDPTAVVEVQGLINANPLFVDSEAGDFRLRPDSPLIDRGAELELPDTDLEGNPRVCRNAPDIGAYEYCGAENSEPALQFLRGDANADGDIDIGDAISLLQFAFVGGPEPYCLDAADGNDDGKINLADVVAIFAYLFGEPPLSATISGRCSTDRTEDILDCRSYEEACGDVVEWIPGAFPEPIMRPGQMRCPPGLQE